MSGPTNAREYVVKAGDTLLGIALEFDVSMAAIQALNDLTDPRLIRAGQTLKVPTRKSQPDESPFWVLHIVESGETLSAIATMFDVPLKELIRVNSIANASSIQIGQKLILPVSNVDLAVQPAPAKPGEAPLPSAPAQAQVQVQAQAQDQAPEPNPAPAPAVVIVPQVANVADGDIEGMRTQLLELYNQVRFAAGLPPLQTSSFLQQSAQLHAEDCASRGFGSHVGSDGANSRQRISRVGYTGRITGENWVWARTAVNAFDKWYVKEIPDGPHLKNILSPQYAEVGFGIAASKGGYYVIANFGAP